MTDSTKILEMIRSGKMERERAIRILYKDKSLQNGVKKVIGYSVNKENDFHEIFNLTLVQFMKKVIENKDFKINSKLNSYLFGMSRNLWLMKLRSKKQSKENDLEEAYKVEHDEISIDLQIIEGERRKNLNILLSKVGEICKQLLTLWSNNYKMSEIAERLGISNEGAARKKKYDCMKNINKILTTNPGLKEKIK